jgi:Protein of unknown function (DUF4240)
MEMEEFWRLIEQSRPASDLDQDAAQQEQAERLLTILTALDAPAILGFRDRWVEYMEQAYRYDLWAVAYIINGGCSDDCFMDFRGWLIAQGRAFYEQALRTPARAADGLEEDYAGFEAILSVAERAYEQKTGGEIPTPPLREITSPAGEPWDEADLPRLYPKLCKRFDF